MNDNMIGVFASFSSSHLDSDSKVAIRKEREDQFKQYLWGADRNGGLSKILKSLHSHEYGQDVLTILLQFNVNPVERWPQPKDIENYRPKEKSIGVWISIGDDYFLKNEAGRQLYVRTAVLDRLKTLKKRFADRKLDTNMDKLISDVEELLT